MNKGREVDGEVERNGCLKPWALEIKKLIEGSNRGQGGFVSWRQDKGTQTVKDKERVKAFHLRGRHQGGADFVWGGKESFRDTVKDIEVFAVVNDH